jgi:ADP-ribose pyrophosphatase YjhB (NUDIX family)
MDRYRCCNNIINDNFNKPKSRLILHTPFVPKSIISYGLIVYAKDTKKSLVIQRKHSAEFLLIIRGLYRKSYLPFLISSIINEEGKKLLSCCNDYDLFNNLYHQELELSPTSYNNSLTRFKESRTLIMKILLLCNLEKNKLSWTWPKGRLSQNNQSSREHPLDCARREFTEETEIILPESLYVSKGYFSELMTTMVGRIVESRYYIYVIPNELKVKTPVSHQEVSDRKWVDNITCKILLNSSVDIIDKVYSFY